MAQPTKKTEPPKAQAPLPPTTDEKVVGKQITLTAGQNGKFNVHFSADDGFTIVEVRQAVMALQRGFHKYRYDLRKKGANR